jgi:hypothetical protein
MTAADASPTLMDDFRQLPALRTILDLARTQVQPVDLDKHVMGDPGTPGYIAAYTLLLQGGIDSLDDDYDGSRLADSFDIGENLLLFHTDASQHVKSRWLSLIASCVELYTWDGFESPRGVFGGTIVSHLLDDGLALAEAHNDARVWRLLPELLVSLLEASENDHLRFAVALGVLISAEPDLDAVAERCESAEALLASFQDPYRERDDEWVPNPWYRRDPVWGPLACSRRDRRRWESLFEACLPTAPASAVRLRERLLANCRSH